MANVSPPKYVKHILITLQSRGHAAYLVGGCVRDMILGVHPQDWDICTSALPEQTLEIFPNSRPTGLKHGTVTVYVNSRSVEVTTFRSDGAYADHRHPTAVSFVGDLTTDLSRRDFTMNAIALPPDGLVVDPFGGVDDIKNRIIRCVGYPELRFEEDALRMFRALRFSARLGFTIEEKTLSAIEKKAPLAASLAPERVRDEVEKILLTRSPEMVYTLIELGLLDAFLKKRMPEPWRLHRLGSIQRKAMPRWAALCCALEKFGCIDSAEEFLDTLLLKRRSACKAAEARRQGSVEARTMRLRGGQRELRRTVLRCFQRRRKRAGAARSPEERRMLLDEAPRRHRRRSARAWSVRQRAGRHAALPA